MCIRKIMNSNAAEYRNISTSAAARRKALMRFALARRYTNAAEYGKKGKTAAARLRRGISSLRSFCVSKRPAVNDGGP